MTRTANIVVSAAVPRVNGALSAGAADAGRRPEGTRALPGEALAALMSSGLSQKRAAREIGISESALSQWLAGKYGGDEAAVAFRVTVWLAARADRTLMYESLPEPPGWIETPSAVRIYAALGYAQLAGDIALIYGGAGMGKTLTARQYAANRPNSWVATMTPATHALGPCLDRVSEACGLRTPGGRASRLEANLRERVEGARGLLIIDEAQHLGLRALEALRGLHDATNGGMALLGNEIIFARLAGGRRAADFAQIHSRVGKRVRLAAPAAKDISLLLDAWRPAVTPEARKLAAAIGRRPGALRGMTKVLRLAALIARGAEIGRPHIEEAWAELGGEG